MEELKQKVENLERCYDTQIDDLKKKVFFTKFRCIILCIAWAILCVIISSASPEIKLSIRQLRSKMFPQKAVTTILKHDPNNLIKIDGKIDLIRKDLAACFANDQILHNLITSHTHKINDPNILVDPNE